jgi:hypothetical protein
MPRSSGRRAATGLGLADRRPSHQAAVAVTMITTASPRPVAARRPDERGIDLSETKYVAGNGRDGLPALPDGFQVTPNPRNHRVISSYQTLAILGRAIGAGRLSELMELTGARQDPFLATPSQ